MTSANFRLGKANDNSAGTTWTWGAYDASITATAAQYIKMEPESTTGIASFTAAIVSADEVSWAAGLPTVSTITATKCATFQIPTGANVGHTYIVRYQVNSGIDSDGVTSATLTKKLAVHTLTPAGYKLFGVDETDENDRTYGHTGKLNDLVRDATAHSNVTPFYATATVAAGGQENMVTVAIAPSAATFIYARAVGVSTAGEAGQYIATYSCKRAGTATAAAVGAGTTSIAATEDDAAWGLSFSFSGAGNSNVLVRVTGDSAATTHWTLDGSYVVTSY